MTAVSQLTAAAGTAASRTSQLTSAREQEDRFMKLLVAQMKNQDPLNPMDNAQMTSQIAQINTVGGLEKLNRTVESLLVAFGALQSQTAMQLPGNDVLVPGGSLTLQDGKATGGFELPRAADAVGVEILDGAGNVVRTMQLGSAPAGVRSFRWDGRLADGQPAADGAWRMRVMASAGGAAVEALPLAAARVDAVTMTPAGPVLDLGSHGAQPLSAVRSYL